MEEEMMKVVSESGMDNASFELGFGVDDIASGDVVPLKVSSQHLGIFVESGTVNLDGRELATGEASYCGHSCDLVAVSACRILTWSLHQKGNVSPSLTAHPIRHMTREIDISPGKQVLRLDAVTFPPGSRAWRHVHSGPGIRYLMQGSLEVVSDYGRTMMEPGDPWFEEANSAVIAIADRQQISRFARVMILPAEYLCKPTINYLDPKDEHKPRLQTNDRYIDQVIYV
jgi:quercetin dioxygenase-like cupin family protein